jgi:hypothetical protein
LCDGREIAPRGFGIKTSDCLVSARNLSDPYPAPERAEIDWRTKQQLVLGFALLLKSPLTAKDQARFRVDQALQEISQLLDLDNDVDLRLVQNLLAEEWACYRKDKGAYTDDKLDLLRVASLTVHFYGTPDYHKLKTQMAWGLEEARRLMAFPTDWQQRWTGEAASAFALEDVAFVFIGRVQCHILSKNLERIGCIVTDCPGVVCKRVGHSRGGESHAQCRWSLVSDQWWRGNWSNSQRDDSFHQRTRLEGQALPQR